MVSSNASESDHVKALTTTYADTKSLVSGLPCHPCQSHADAAMQMIPTEQPTKAIQVKTGWNGDLNG